VSTSRRTSRKASDRRGFLCAGAAGVLAAAGMRELTSAQETTESATGQLPERQFGKTGQKVPILAYGGAALVNRWGNPLSVEDRVELVQYAYQRGIRYFDTAGNYGESQRILGHALKHVRKHVYLVTKVETTDPAKVRPAVESSLEQLQTDYLDALLIHGTPGLEQMTVAQAMKIHDELARLRDERITRFIGFSAHSYFDKALALIDSGAFDQCMLSCGYFSRGYNQIHSQRMMALRDACVAKAHARGMGIAAMKVIGGGVLGAWAGYIVPQFDKKRVEQLPAAAIRYVLSDPRIHVLVIGMRLKREIDANIEIITGDGKCTLEDRALLAEFSAAALDSDAIKKMRID